MAHASVPKYFVKRSTESEKDSDDTAKSSTGRHCRSYDYPEFDEVSGDEFNRRKKRALSIETTDPNVMAIEAANAKSIVEPGSMELQLPSFVGNEIPGSTVFGFLFPNRSFPLNATNCLQVNSHAWELDMTIFVGEAYTEVSVLQQFSGINAIMFYAGAIFKSAGFSNSDVASLGLGSIQVFMTAVAASLMDKAGRRLLLMISAGGLAVSSFLVGFAFYLQAQLPHPSHMDTFVSMLSLISMLVYIISFSLGMGAIPWILMSEVLPSHVRGVAGSLATLANWGSAWAVTMTFNLMLEWSAAGSFWVFAGECAFTVVFVALIVPETRGRTLEEIEALFK